MSWRAWTRSLYSLLRPGKKSGRAGDVRARGQVTHFIILDGTMSSLDEGCESNAGLAFKLLQEAAGASISVYYEAGVQWEDWRRTPDVLMGRGINRQIRRAYGYLASRYHRGDRIIFLGYSRGAYAVRSLAGMIDQVGLLKTEHATERNILTAFRHYQSMPGGGVAAQFTEAFCHKGVTIEMVGVWDTVKALGLRLPILWRWSEPAHAFHSHELGRSIKRGYHALALNETRKVYEPVLWDCPSEFDGEVEQVWFRGTHGDVGGQLFGYGAARPLANIPLVWMMEKVELCGVPLPKGWQARFVQDVNAPSVSTWRGWGKIFLIRGRRRVGRDRSERIHESVTVQVTDLPGAEAIQ